MKENIQNIQTGLLVLIAATVLYGTFLKGNDSSNSDDRGIRHRKTERKSNIAATPPSAVPPNKPAPAPAPVQQIVNNPTTMSFEEMSHDFGNIDQDSENKYTFKFTNTGDKPLIIETATGSCGCTIPEFPREPIAPGATSEIKVVYKPGKQKGLQNKTVTVIANTQPKDTRLNITANVQEVK
tara:strand:- start:24040 stop:24585 length:546 start_codon:yes stop_codon:yes gene_type:complete